MKTLRLGSFLLLASILGSTLQVSPVRAGGCFEDPVYTYDWSGTISSAVYVRSVACIDGSTILTSLTAGAKVSVTGTTDGWVRVKLSDGTEGWVGEQFISVSQSAYTYPVATPTTTSASTTLSSSAAAAVRARTVGYILLQVEDHGEAWYVDPVTKHRFYMKDGPTAYEMMRTFGLGMNEADYARLAAGDRTLINSLKGRIVLRVQQHGEAYYIHPDGTVYYLADGPAAYALMRLHSLGITNADLDAVAIEELTLVPYGDDGVPVEVLGEIDEQGLVPVKQTGLNPSSFNAEALNELWVDLLNAERVDRGLKAVTGDQRLINSATTWSNYLGEQKTLTHERPGGQALLSWIGEFGYDFTVTGANGYWTTSMFGENLALVYAYNSEDSMESAVQTAMNMFMAEESYNGPHYVNVVNPDWNTTGLGIYVDKYNSQTYKLYLTFHFASLVQ